MTKWIFHLEPKTWRWTCTNTLHASTGCVVRTKYLEIHSSTRMALMARPMNHSKIQEKHTFNI